MSSIGTRIKSLRINLGLKGAELARRIGISGPALWEIENGETKSLKASTLVGLVAELHTTSDHILFCEAKGEDLRLAEMEAELIHSLRALPPEKRLELMNFARFLLGQPRQAVAKVTVKKAAVKQSTVRHIRQQNSK